MGSAIRLFRFAGIQVYLHFSWFLVGAYVVMMEAKRYQSGVWAIFEYITLFAIVLTHEFGHALACRQTGGRADRIVLWPLGGIAFVNPPPRPSAYLWSLAAGPLVNAILFPILSGFVWLAPFTSLGSDARLFVYTIWQINMVLLVFNLLPIYPLDGGQILRGLLWFAMGPIRSLRVASGIGILGAIGMILIAVVTLSPWYGVLALFVFSQAVSGWQQAKALAATADAARAAASPPVPPPLPPPPG